MNNIILNLQIACDITHYLPSKIDLMRWLVSVLPKFHKSIEVTIRIVNEAESHTLNMTYRNKNYATNVLTFIFDIPSIVKLPLLGDIVICCKIVEREAQQQKKTLEAHWAHIVIHGTLHLLGYDHIVNKKALKMELLERKIMKKLGYPDPYINDNKIYNTICT